MPAGLQPAEHGESCTLDHDHAADLRGPCAEREADADLVRALRDEIGDDAVESDRAEDECDGGRGDEREHREAETDHGVRHDLLVRGAGGDRSGAAPSVVKTSRDTRCAASRAGAAEAPVILTLASVKMPLDSNVTLYVRYRLYRPDDIPKSS